VFEWHPQNQPPHDVLLSQLGTFQFKRKYPAGEPATNPTPPPGTGTRTRARVTRVVDGDTIDVSIANQTFRVRYIGVNTPETVDPGSPVECYGPEASAFNKSLVEGKVVELEKDVSETDRFGRLLRYVYVGGTFVNAELIKQGYAQVNTFPPDVKYTEMFRQLEQEARTARRGLWGAGCQTPPTITTTPLPQPPPPAQATPTRPSGGGGGVCGTPYSPTGPDRDCGDFSTQSQAQCFFRAAGGPGRDPHRLDADNDGIACESLP
jgi:micrococcal nuclease